MWGGEGGPWRQSMALMGHDTDHRLQCVVVVAAAAIAAVSVGQSAPPSNTQTWDSVYIVC